jgi:hypothetical protein
MMSPAIERAAITATPEDIAVKLRNAPAWVRAAAKVAGRAVSPSQPVSKPVSTPAAKPVSKPQARAKAPVIGWLAGTCCPGVSRPCPSSKDSERLPEQFTPRAWETMLAQVRFVKGEGVPLTLGHDGPVIARSGDLDLTFSIDRFAGLEFEARLRDTPAGRKVLDAIGTSSLGVSIGYRKSTQWIVERDGIGRVRIIDDAILDHIALIAEKGTNRRAAYSAARCYGRRSTGVGCPRDARESARSWAFQVVREQAGCSR